MIHRYPIKSVRIPSRIRPIKENSMRNIFAFLPFMAAAALAEGFPALHLFVVCQEKQYQAASEININAEDQAEGCHCRQGYQKSKVQAMVFLIKGQVDGSQYFSGKLKYQETKPPGSGRHSKNDWAGF